MVVIPAEYAEILLPEPEILECMSIYQLQWSINIRRLARDRCTSHGDPLSCSASLFLDFKDSFALLGLRRHVFMTLIQHDHTDLT